MAEDAELFTARDGAPEKCACGTTLSECDYCHEDRCLHCDPYDQDGIERGAHAFSGRITAPLSPD